MWLLKEQNLGNYLETKRVFYCGRAAMKSLAAGKNRSLKKTYSCLIIQEIVLTYMFVLPNDNKRLKFRTPLQKPGAFQRWSFSSSDFQVC